MTAIDVPAPSAPAPDPAPKEKHRQGSLAGGIFLIILGAAIAVLFGLGAESGLDTRFVIDETDARFDLPELVLPSRGTAFLLAVLCWACAGYVLTRGKSRARTVVIAIAIGLFVFAFLVWAVRGDDMNLLGMFQTTLLRATPIALGAFAGVLCERSGVVNIAIEGMMLSAAFTGAITASAMSNRWGGLLCAMAIGALLGLVLATLSIRYEVDQIIGGTVINFFALGMTSYLGAQVLSEYQDLNRPPTFTTWEIPLLSDIPIAGPLLFANNLFVYVMLILAAVMTIALFRTKWGLRTRAVGEHPRAADTVGINVYRVRYRNVMMGGAVAALAGASLTLGTVGSFEENMTAGRGFIALAALIVGRWNPVGAVGAALIFGFAESLQGKLALFDTNIPSEFLLMAPYIATLLVVAGFAGRVRAPAADGQPYVKE